MRFVSTFDKHRKDPGKSLPAYAKDRRLQLGRDITERHKIYLDTKYWVLLRDHNLNRLSALLHEGVRSQRLICPIGGDIFAEIMTQGDPATLRASVDLMTHRRSLPDDPIRFIQDCVRRRRILWTYHVNMRLVGRFISRETILDAVDTFELVEAYPEDKYLPSYLLLGRTEAHAFHALFTADVEGDNVRIVTAYHPDAAEWQDDFKSRRPRR